MLCKLTGKVIFAAEPKKLKSSFGGPDKVCKEFHLLCNAHDGSPDLVKVRSFNGFNPKMNEVVTVDCKVGARVWGTPPRADLTVEVL
jgi:hypothetical protein